MITSPVVAPFAGASAYSADGRLFRTRLQLADAVLPGDLVVLRPEGGSPLLAQVHDTTVEVGSDGGLTAPTVQGDGAIIGTLDDDGAVRRGPVAPFGSAQVERVSVAVADAFQAGAGAALPVGTRQMGDGDATVAVKAGGFNRHTFLVGQSGSGKTYALGVLLEQLLVHTRLRIVVLDPNGDFVRLGELRASADAASPSDAAALREQAVRVLRPAGEAGEAGEALHVRFPRLSVQAQAAVVKLDPVLDRDEYETVHAWTERLRAGTDPDLDAFFAEDSTPGAALLRQRLANLGILEWEIWARAAGRPFTEVLDEGARATVLDLAGFAHPEERSLAAVALLDHLWEHRTERIPTLVVIDEAHNVCSADPVDQLQRLATDRLVQIAGEGRKYGLWLLLSTQRPSKIHPNVLSQCDNLALMRVNSPADLAELGSVFGFTPAAMLAASPRFGLGEVLLAGSFVPAPTFARMRERLTPEGGADVPVPLP